MYAARQTSNTSVITILWCLCTRRDQWNITSFKNRFRSRVFVIPSTNVYQHYYKSYTRLFNLSLYRVWTAVCFQTDKVTLKAPTYEHSQTFDRVLRRCTVIRRLYYIYLNIRLGAVDCIMRLSRRNHPKSIVNTTKSVTVLTFVLVIKLICCGKKSWVYIFPFYVVFHSGYRLFVW